MGWNYELGSSSGDNALSFDVANSDNLAIVGATGVDLVFTWTPSDASDI